MKSHIQVPKSLLKRFSHSIEECGHEGHVTRVLSIFALDINKGNIIEEKINDFGIAEGFYSDETEKFLGENIESPFGELCNTILANLKKNLPIKLSKAEKQIIYLFCHYSLVRAPRQVASINENTFLKALGIKTSPSMLVNLTDICPFPNNPFADRYITIIHNTSEIDFVLPFHCIYLTNTEVKGQDIIMLPISPKFSLILWYCKDGNEDTIQVDDFDEVKVIEGMNDWAFRTELTNKQYLIATNRQQLERYQSILKNNN